MDCDTPLFGGIALFMGFSLNMKTMVEKESYKRTNKVKIKKKNQLFLPDGIHGRMQT